MSPEIDLLRERLSALITQMNALSAVSTPGSREEYNRLMDEYTALRMQYNMMKEQVTMAPLLVKI